MALDSTSVAYAAQDMPAALTACQSAGVQFFSDNTAQVYSHNLLVSYLVHLT